MSSERRKRLGLCVDCGGNRDSPKSIRCRLCLRRKAERERQRCAKLRDELYRRLPEPIPLPAYGLLEGVKPPPPKEPEFRPDYRNESLNHLK